MPTLICECNQTMPLQPKALGAALDENLSLHSALCRREVGAFLQAIKGSDEVVVGRVPPNAAAAANMTPRINPRTAGVLEEGVEWVSALGARHCLRSHQPKLRLDQRQS